MMYLELNTDLHFSEWQWASDSYFKVVQKQFILGSSETGAQTMAVVMWDHVFIEGVAVNKTVAATGWLKS